MSWLCAGTPAFPTDGSESRQRECHEKQCGRFWDDRRTDNLDTTYVGITPGADQGRHASCWIDCVQSILCPKQGAVWREDDGLDVSGGSDRWVHVGGYAGRWVDGDQPDLYVPAE